MELSVLVNSEEEYQIIGALVDTLRECIPTACLLSLHLAFPLDLLSLGESKIRDPSSLEGDGGRDIWPASCPDLFALGRLEGLQEAGNFGIQTQDYMAAFEADSLSSTVTARSVDYPANLLRNVAKDQVRRSHPARSEMNARN